MGFDPFTNYAPHMKDPEQLLFWNFSELIKTLITLSATAERQLEIMASPNAAEEMLLDFESFYSLVFRKYLQARLLNYGDVELLDDLKERFNQMDKDTLTTEGLYEDPAWEEIRHIASRVLLQMDMNDLDLRLESSLRQEEKDGESKKEILQQKRKIVRK